MNDKDFEHKLDEKLKAFDALITVPEIPDAQSIFERAESEKKVIPFRFSKYAVAVAAVLILFVSVPFIKSSLLMGSSKMSKSSEIKTEAVQEYMLIANDYEGFSYYDSESEEIVNSEESEESEASNATDFDEFGSGNSTIYCALYDLFRNEENNTDEVKESATGNSNGGNSEGTLTEVLNKKRSIEVEVLDGSVSVILYDTSGEKEMLTAFWVEGNYRFGKSAGGNYTINMTNTVTEEEFESGYYMPMAGDDERGNYYLSENDVAVIEPVTEGIFEITVTINIERGEYDISAVLR